MVIVDNALKQREDAANPIRVALVGAGYSGKNIAYQIINSTVGMRLVAIANRTLDSAKRAFFEADIKDVEVGISTSHIESCIDNSKSVVTTDVGQLCAAGNIDAIIEATGTIEFGASVVLKVIENGKHVILLNAELDATLGPILKQYAARAGVVYTNSDGDEPGVAMNICRFVQTIGLKPVVAGNLKGLYDPYRTPETQQEFALKHNQKPETMTSFADGTKLSMELAVLANATGFGVARRGMFGHKCSHVNDALKLFSPEDVQNGGYVDFLCGAAPGTGAFVIGHSEKPVTQAYLHYLKMGAGPYYLFYTPFHLPHLEIPITVARAVLFNDATVAPRGGPTCDVITVAKKDLKADEKLDGLGGFTCYSLLENYEASRKEDLLPMGVSDGCVLKNDIARDTAISYSDVELPAGRLCDRLRTEQTSCFH